MAKMPSSDVDKSVGKRIKQARKEKGITVAELSELIDLAAQTISRYERGENKINLGHLFLIVKALHVRFPRVVYSIKRKYCNEYA